MCNFSGLKSEKIPHSKSFKESHKVFVLTCGYVLNCGFWVTKNTVLLRCSSLFIFCFWYWQIGNYHFPFLILPPIRITENTASTITAEIHKGESTHIQLHLITPNSLSTIKIIVRTDTMPSPPCFVLLFITDLRRWEYVGLRFQKCQENYLAISPFFLSSIRKTYAIATPITPNTASRMSGVFRIGIKHSYPMFKRLHRSFCPSSRWFLALCIFRLSWFQFASVHLLATVTV